MSDAATPVLWLWGPSGVGKTTVGWETYSQLVGAGIDAGYVDIDQLGICFPNPTSDADRERMKARNAGAVVANFRAAGARCVVVSSDFALHGSPMDELRHAAVTVCRLRVAPDELRQRLMARADMAEQVDEVLREADEMDASTVADMAVDTTGMSVAEVAALVRERAGRWPDFTGLSRLSGPPPAHVAKAGDGLILWLYGATGVGKSTVGFAVYEKVLRAGVVAAYVDVDQLGFCGPAPADDRLKAVNLAAVWRTYRGAGAHSLLVVGHVDGETAVKVYEDALPAATITWCRLHAGRDRLTERILLRGQGGSWQQPGDPLRGRPIADLLRIAGDAFADADTLERSPIGLRIDTDRRTVEEAADAILAQTTWPGVG